MGDLESLWFILAILVVLGTPLAVLALILIDKLRRRLDIVEAELAGLRGGPVLSESSSPPADQPAQPVETEVVPEVAARDEQAVSEPVAAPPPWKSGGGSAPPEPTSASPRRSFESRLASQWMVWLGGAVVALSVVFLFRYAIEQGWLGPVARVGLGVLLGALLVGGGEFLRRKTPEGDDRYGRNHVPAALTAAGLFALFMAFYAAHALYGLIGPVVAFALLAAISFAAVIMAGTHGRFVAVLGMVGGYLVPGLAASPESNAAALFVYLFALTGGCLWLLTYRKWRFLAFATILGSVGWPAFWLALIWHAGDQGVLGLYLLALAAIYAWFDIPLLKVDHARGWRGTLTRLVMPDTSSIGMVASAVLLLALAERSDFNSASFWLIAAHALIAFYFGLRRNAVEAMLIIAALTSVALFAIWPQPMDISASEDVVRRGVEYVRTALGPFDLPPEFLLFARAALGFAVLFGFGATLALRYARTPAIWAAVAVLMPLYLLALAYWRIDAFAVDVGWAGLSVVLALLYLAAASWMARRRSELGDEPLAFYAAAATAALALALVCVLREAWLTVALALEVLALAWIWSRLQVRQLQWIAGALASVVIVRLALNPQILDYRGTVAGAVSWVIYGYGLPALCFYRAARIFSRSDNKVTAVLCDAGALAFGILMVSFQIRIWMSGLIAAPVYGLAETAVQSLWWIIAGAVLSRDRIAMRSVVARVGGRLLLGAAVLQVVGVHVLLSNPALTGEGVGTWPLVNLLGLAYLAPAVAFLVLALVRGFGLPEIVRRGLGIAAFVLLFLYLSLETLRWSQGATAYWLGGLSDGELYALSVVWIGFALGLLFAAIRFRSPLLRYGSLVVMIGTVLKVFMFDMAGLTGLLRVASFLGLGLTLIGIGMIYRRFVFDAPEPEAETDEAE